MPALPTTRGIAAKLDVRRDLLGREQPRLYQVHFQVYLSELTLEPPDVNQRHRQELGSDHARRKEAVERGFFLRPMPGRA